MVIYHFWFHDAETGMLLSSLSSFLEATNFSFVSYPCFWRSFHVSSGSLEVCKLYICKNPLRVNWPFSSKSRNSAISERVSSSNYYISIHDLSVLESRLSDPQSNTMKQRVKLPHRRSYPSRTRPILRCSMRHLQSSKNGRRD